MQRMKEIAEMILAEGKKLGADVVTCSVSESEKKEFNVDGGRFSLMRTLFDRSVNIVTLKDGRKGTTSINRFDEESVKNALKQCMDACNSAQPDPAWEYCSEARQERYVQGEPVCDTEKLFERTKELLETIKAEYPKIIMEQMITSHDCAKAVYMNSYGVKMESEAGAYSFSLMYSAHEGEKGTSFYGSDVTLAKLDKPVIETAFIRRELEAVQNQLDPKPLEGKFTGTVLLAPLALLEIVLGTVLSNFVSDSSLIDGTSIWKDKLNEKVADERLNVSFTPHAEHVVIGQRYTGEGYRAEDFDLIKDGRLVSFNLSQYGANKTGFKRAGCSCWNVSVKPGNKALDELIGGIERGVLVMRFSGGEPSAAGEFSGVAKNSFLIENGKIVGALTETMISGCVPDMLGSIRDISSDTLLDGSLSVPYIAFDGVTISGS